MPRIARLLATGEKTALIKCLVPVFLLPVPPVTKMLFVCCGFFFASFMIFSFRFTITWPSVITDFASPPIETLLSNFRILQSSIVPLKFQLFSFYKLFILNVIRILIMQRLVLWFVSSITYFIILFHRPLRLRRKGRRVKYYFFWDRKSVV